MTGRFDKELTGVHVYSWTDEYDDGSVYRHELVLIGQEVLFGTQRPTDGEWVNMTVRNPERFGPLDWGTPAQRDQQWRAWVDNFMKGVEA